MSLSITQLLKVLDPEKIYGEIGKSKDIVRVTSDSREVTKGTLFIAVRGEIIDGHEFINDAYQQGAEIIVGEKEIDPPYGKVYIKVKNSRIAERLLLRESYGFPDKEMVLIGVTGTNGKTTITYILESIFNTANFKTGVIGTVNWRYCNLVRPSRNTTPSFKEILKLLNEMRTCKVENVIMEVSSHSLVQKRVDGFHFNAGIFTNLSRDHLDYHKNMEDYYRAKARLFKEILPGSDKRVFAVIGVDTKWGRRLSEEIKEYKVLTYGFNDADAKIVSLKVENFRMHLTLEVNKKKYEVNSELFGDYNAQNILAAFLTAYHLGLSPKKIIEGIETLKGVPGRLERLELPSGVFVFIDYAHTPDAIENVLRAVKKYSSGRIISVFGAGGDRDTGKRKPMGEAAASFSDVVIVTSDNPRTEDPEKIIEMVAEGVQIHQKNFFKIPERKEAIFKALNIANKNDVVMILGKGHEDYQIIGKNVIHFSDREVVEEFLELKK